MSKGKIVESGVCDGGIYVVVDYADGCLIITAFLENDNYEWLNKSTQLGNLSTNVLAKRLIHELKNVKS